MREDEAFRLQYRRAREDQADYFADEILEIADDSTNDFMERKDGTEYCDQENIQRSRLRVDTRKWFAARMAPKVYGERPNETHVSTTLNNFIVLTPEKQAELQERRKRLLNG